MSLFSNGSVASAAVLFQINTKFSSMVSVLIRNDGNGSTITYETSEDDVTYTAVSAGYDVTSGSYQAISSTTNRKGRYVFATPGRFFRARVSTYVSGTVTGNAEPTFENLSYLLNPPSSGDGTGLSPPVITNVDTGTGVVTGTALAGATVKVYLDNTAQTGTATANGSGAWTYTIPSLSAGSHSVTATQTASVVSAKSSARSANVSAGGLPNGQSYLLATDGSQILDGSGNPIIVGDGGQPTDTTPAAFTFTDVTAATLSTVYTSNTITVSGINDQALVEITGGPYSKNGGAYVSTPGYANSGDTFAVRVTSSGTNSTGASATLTIGGVSDTYTVTTVAAVGGGSTFAPTDLTGLYAWYDATDTASLTLQDDTSTSGQVGNEVYSWANKKPGGPALTQVGNGLHPIYQAASFNGKAALQVGGAPLKLDGTVAINSSTFWWFVAIKSLADTEQGAILSFAGASGTDFSSANGFLFFFDDTAGGVRLYHNSGAIDIGYPTKAFNNGVAGIVGAVADGSQAKLYVDGTSVGSASFSGTPNMTQVRIGASAAADAQHMSSALIGEILIGTGALTTQNITDINAYLAAKWTA